MTENGPDDLNALDAQLKAARERNPAPESRSGPSEDKPGMALGMRLSAELLAGVLVGLGVGWALDKWLGTGPWLLLVFLLLGTAAGIFSVIRSGTKPDAK